MDDLMDVESLPISHDVAVPLHKSQHVESPPLEIITEIAKFLSAKEILNVSLCSHAVRNTILNKKELWHNRRIVFIIDFNYLLYILKMYVVVNKVIDKIAYKTAVKIGAILCSPLYSDHFHLYSNIARMINFQRMIFVCVNCCVKYLLHGSRLDLLNCSLPHEIAVCCNTCNLRVCMVREKKYDSANHNGPCLNCNHVGIMCCGCGYQFATTSHVSSNASLSRRCERCYSVICNKCHGNSTVCRPQRFEGGVFPSNKK